MTNAAAQGLSGMRVALFESRFADEFARLVEKQGATPLVGPTLVEAPLELGPEVRAFADALRGGELDALLVLTGAGQRKLVTLLAPIMPQEELGDCLSRVLLAARGPKAVQALRELGLKAQIVAPEPHTWQTLLEALAAFTPLADKLVALQQYGVPHERLTGALVERGARVLQVPVYRWQLPEDLSPLERVIDEICAGRVEVILFTSGPQAGVLFEVARKRAVEPALRAALARMGVGSVGPSCTEALRNLELEPDFEPEHGKMGHLVREAARSAPELLAKKRGPGAG